MFKSLSFLVVGILILPTLVLAKSIGFLTFDKWKAEKIKSAISAKQKIEAIYSIQSKLPANKQAVKMSSSDLQSTSLAVQTAKNLRLDDYLAVYWAPRAEAIPIEKIALDLSPAQVKELLTAYVGFIGLNKNQTNQYLKVDRLGSK